MASVDAFAPPSAIDAQRSMSGFALTWSVRALITTTWISTALFGLYILAFYAAAVIDGDLANWNESLPQLYEPHTPVATSGIGLFRH